MILWVDVFALPQSSRRVLAVFTSSDYLDFTQIREETGLADRTLRFALSRLREEGLIRELTNFKDMRSKQYAATYSSVLRAIGNTPIIRLKKIGGERLFAKLDSLNPSGSIKDVMAHYMIGEAEKRGELKPGQKIIEVTTGNTGISFAMLSSIRGYKFTAVMPENMSVERRQMMQAFGAEVILTPAKDDIAGAIRKYEKLAKKNPGAWLPKQFDNPDNIAAHREITGKEILKQIKRIDAFVAGVGTGGTLMGVAEAVRKVNPKVRIIAVEPAESAVMSGKKPGPHGIQGIGEGFIPKLVDMDRIDQVIAIKTKDAEEIARRLAREEGLLVGISSGANVLASLKVARKIKGNIVTVLPDRGERYLSEGLFNIKGG